MKIPKDPVGGGGYYIDPASAPVETHTRQPHTERVPTKRRPVPTPEDTYVLSEEGGGTGPTTETSAQIDLRGIRRELAERLIAHRAFNGWGDYVDGMPGPLKTLHSELLAVREGTLSSTLSQTSEILKSAGFLIDQADKFIEDNQLTSRSEDFLDLKREAWEITKALGNINAGVSGKLPATKVIR